MGPARYVGVRSRIYDVGAAGGLIGNFYLKALKSPIGKKQAIAAGQRPSGTAGAYRGLMRH